LAAEAAEAEAALETVDRKETAAEEAEAEHMRLKFLPHQTLLAEMLL
jgi:hypothetical protein